jgi:hypothetical protein
LCAWTVRRFRVGFGLGVVDLLLRRRHRVIELRRVEPRIVERVTPAPVRQRQFGGHPDVGFLDGLRSPPGRMRHSGARHHEVGPHPVDVERRTQSGDAA